MDETPNRQFSTAHLASLPISELIAVHDVLDTLWSLNCRRADVSAIADCLWTASIAGIIDHIIKKAARLLSLFS